MTFCAKYLCKEFMFLLVRIAVTDKLLNRPSLCFQTLSWELFITLNQLGTLQIYAYTSTLTTILQYLTLLDANLCTGLTQTVIVSGAPNLNRFCRSKSYVVRVQCIFMCLTNQRVTTMCKDLLVPCSTMSMSDNIGLLQAAAI